ncbi:TPA: hypothetical protein ACXIJH_005043 [Serratia marcescens]
MLELRIITGQNEGAAFPVIEGEYRVGGSCFNDIVIPEMNNEQDFLLVGDVVNGWFVNKNNDDEKTNKRIEIDEIFELYGVRFIITDSKKEWQRKKKGSDHFSDKKRNALLISPAVVLFVVISVLLLSPQTLKKKT